MRLFLDANILFSAAYRDGSPAALLIELSNAGRCQLVSSAFALEEARRNVAAKAAPRVTVLEQLAAQVTIGLEPTRDQLLTAASSPQRMPQFWRQPLPLERRHW
jgi:predicted nucleic acid-binding protein